MSIARTDTATGCPDSGMPIEPLGSDKEQHEALYQQARACVREGKPLRAVALLTQIIKYDATSAIAYLNRGSAQASAGEVALAIGDFSVAINLRPDLAEAWYNRGTTFTHIRRFQNAIADFTEAGEDKHTKPSAIAVRYSMISARRSTPIHALKAHRRALPLS